MTPTVGSLYAGIGGIDLGLERAGFTVAWQVENDPWCQTILHAHWPTTPLYGDITTLNPADLQPVDLIAAGFPCQDISSAHTRTPRKGLNGEQSGLWAQTRQVIAALRPSCALLENSARWKAWMPTVRAELAGLGYASVPLLLSAGSFGAPHRRPRGFLVANADGDRESLRAIYAEVAQLRPLPRAAWPVEPSPMGVDDGIPHRVDRLRGLGNAVVPQVAEWVGRRILAAYDLNGDPRR